MSVIVKGIDVPRDCDGCWHPTCNLWLQTDVGKRHRDCPISPMPEKHGRLIDADALHALYESRWHDLQVLNWDENPHAEDIQTGVNWCINTLHDDLPTIVEAEV